MTATMKAFRLTEWAKPPRLVEVPVPKPERGQILVKVGGAGLCHSDIGMMAMPEAAGRMAGWNMPFTLGHEVGGWVAEAGDGLKGVAPGDPVVLVSAYSCGHCQFCLSGHDNSCVETYAGRGYGRDGGLAEYVLVDSPRAVIKLTSLDPRDAGPLSDAGATAYHAVKRVLPKLTPGSTAAVIGAGGLGMFAIQFLRVMSPAKIIAVDQNPNRLALALASGAHEAVTGVDTFTSAAIKEHSGGIGAEAVLDFVGNDASLEQGLAAVRSVGSFALVGAGARSIAICGPISPRTVSCSPSRAARSATCVRSSRWSRPGWSRTRRNASRSARWRRPIAASTRASCGAVPWSRRTSGNKPAHLRERQVRASHCSKNHLDDCWAI